MAEVTSFPLSISLVRDHVSSKNKWRKYNSTIGVFCNQQTKIMHLLLEIWKDLILEQLTSGDFSGEQTDVFKRLFSNTWPGVLYLHDMYNTYSDKEMRIMLITGAYLDNMCVMAQKRISVYPCPMLLIHWGYQPIFPPSALRTFPCGLRLPLPISLL
jgi:hypothetical protein